MKSPLLYQDDFKCQAICFWCANIHTPRFLRADFFWGVFYPGAPCQHRACVALDHHHPPNFFILTSPPPTPGPLLSPPPPPFFFFFFPPPPPPLSLPYFTIDFSEPTLLFCKVSHVSCALSIIKFFFFFFKKKDKK